MFVNVQAHVVAILGETINLLPAGRELFPHSNCLKAQQREGMLHEEITYSNADILCLQVRSQSPKPYYT